MSSNSVKLDSARKWHRRLSHLNQADGTRNAPETVRDFDAACKMCTLAKITKTQTPRVTDTRAQELLKRVLTDFNGQNVLVRCRRSAGEGHTREDTAEWVT